MAFEPMGTVIYRFDNTDAFGLLEVAGAKESAVSVTLGGSEQARSLRIQWMRREADASKVAIVLSLPPRRVDGTPDRWLLDAAGRGPCRVTLIAGDTYGAGFDYALGVIDDATPHILSAAVAEPTGLWGERSEAPDEPVTPPMELYRIRLLLSEECQRLDIMLHALHATGDVRLGAPGIA